MGLELCRLTGAELAESTLQDITFSECRLDLVGFRHAKLQRVVFRDCRMGECDFSGARLEDVLFERCELTQASFAGVTIARVDLMVATLPPSQAPNRSAGRGCRGTMRSRPARHSRPRSVSS